MCIPGRPRRRPDAVAEPQRTYHHRRRTQPLVKVGWAMMIRSELKLATFRCATGGDAVRCRAPRAANAAPCFALWWANCLATAQRAEASHAPSAVSLNKVVCIVNAYLAVQRTPYSAKHLATMC